MRHFGFRPLYRKTVPVAILLWSFLFLQVVLWGERGGTYILDWCTIAGGGGVGSGGRS